MPQGFVNAGRRIRLHAGQHMRIQVQCNSDRGVAKPFLCDFGMNTARQQMGRVAVPEVMKADLRQSSAGDEADELMGKTVRLQRLTIGLGNYVRVFRLAHADP